MRDGPVTRQKRRIDELRQAIRDNAKQGEFLRVQLNEAVAALGQMQGKPPGHYTGLPEPAPPVEGKADG